MSKVTTKFDAKNPALLSTLESGETFNVKFSDLNGIKIAVPESHGGGESDVLTFATYWGLKELFGNGGAASGKSHDNSKGDSEALQAMAGRLATLKEGNWRGGGGGGKSTRLTQDERAICILAEKQGKPFDVEADDIKESIEVAVIAAAKKGVAAHNKKAPEQSQLAEPKDAKEAWKIVRQSKDFVSAKETVRREDNKKKASKGIDSLEL